MASAVEPRRRPLPELRIVLPPSPRPLRNGDLGGREVAPLSPDDPHEPALYMLLPSSPQSLHNGDLEGREVAPLSPDDPNESEDITTHILGLCMRVNQAIGRLQAFKSHFAGCFPRLLNRVKEGLELGDDRFLDEFHLNVRQINFDFSLLADLIQTATQSGGTDYAGMLSYTESAFQETKPTEMENDMDVAYHIAYIDRFANALFAQEGSLEDRVRYLDQLQRLFQRISQDVPGRYRVLNDEQSRMINDRRDNIIAGVANMQRQGVLPPREPILPPLVTSKAIDHFSHLYTTFDESVWSRLPFGSESAERRVAVFEDIAKGFGLTTEQLGRVYYFVWKQAEDKFNAGAGPKPEGLHFGRDHACDDPIRLKEAIGKARDKLPEVHSSGAAALA